MSWKLDRSSGGHGTKTVPSFNDKRRRTPWTERGDDTTAISPRYSSQTAGRQGRWKPLTVNGSCSHSDRRGGTPPPNINKWCGVNRSYLCEPPWVTTVTITACAALRKCHGGCNSSW
ncbi:unnamed protein product [Gadus morhua 'NCC']